MRKYSQFKLTADQLALIRGERLLFKQCSFTLENGEVLQIRGPNGAGKTSLLRVVCGVLEQDSGDIYWNDCSLHQSRSQFYESSIYIGHSLGIKERLTVLENLTFYGQLRSQPPRIPYSEAIAQVGLAGFEDEYAGYLSQGQKRRVSLARLLLEPAALWILDEPFVALDTEGQAWLADLIDEQVNSGGGVIFTSHQPVNLRAEPAILDLGALH